MKDSRSQLYSLGLIVFTSTFVLFVCSSLRHFLFQCNAVDLGWFDQAIYLISQGKTPIVSFVNYHILGDHAAFIVYPLALLYKIYPDVHWLFAIQAIALSLGALPIWKIASIAGLKNQQATAIVIIYLLYPLIFNLNLFDFHPEVIALPAFFAAILAARLQNIWLFLSCIIIILSCKAILSLTIAAMGVWLFWWENRKWYGAIAIFLGITWFLISTQIIIPFFTGHDVAIEMADQRYRYLGNSLGEIMQNLFLKPGLVVGKLFTLANLEYLLLLIIPIIWGLFPRYLTPLIAAIPALSLNLLADYQPQKDLVHQYSLPILPFLILSVITTTAAGKSWLKKPRNMILWSLIAFLALAKYTNFSSLYLDSLDTLQATHQAIAQVDSQGSLLTASQIAPHLTHRSLVKLAIAGSEAIDLQQFDYVLLNKRHPGWQSSPELVDHLVTRLRQMPEFKLTYTRDDVFLFEKFNF